jgi:hypothetical protein
MESRLMDRIVNLVRDAEPDLDARLESQADALRDLKCTNPILGQWIDTYDVQYLLAAFALNDADFADDFPKLAHLKEAEREIIIKAFEDHFDQCSHCHLKRGYDLESNSRIERACKATRNEAPSLPNQPDKIASSKEGQSPKVLMFRASN